MPSTSRLNCSPNKEQEREKNGKMPVHLVKHQMDRTRLEQSSVFSTSGGGLRTPLSHLLLSGVDKYNIH